MRERFSKNAMTAAAALLLLGAAPALAQQTGQDPTTSGTMTGSTATTGALGGDPTLGTTTGPASDPVQTGPLQSDPAQTDTMSSAGTMAPGGSRTDATTQGAPAQSDTTMTGSTTGSEEPALGGVPPATGGTRVLAEVDVPEGTSARQRVAVVQTALLNRFSQLGFSEIREFRREGETYVAEATDPEGEEVTVVLDPASGTIVARR